MSKLELIIPPPFIGAIFAALMWFVSQHTLDVPLPDHFKIISFVVFACIGAIFDISALLSFRKAKTTINPITPQAASSLVTSGIYTKTRNPMYVGLLCFLIAWGLYLANGFSLALLIGFVLYLNRFQIQPEERILVDLFGAEYSDYKKQVRRWL